MTFILHKNLCTTLVKTFLYDLMWSLIISTDSLTDFIWISWHNCGNVGRCFSLSLILLIFNGTYWKLPQPHFQINLMRFFHFHLKCTYLILDSLALIHFVVRQILDITFITGICQLVCSFWCVADLFLYLQ